MKPNWLKIASLTLTLIGAGVTMASDWLGKKELDAKIAEKVAEALAKK